MFDEYFHRTAFVLAHAGLLLIYAIMVWQSHLAFSRERKALKWLQHRILIKNNSLEGATPASNATEAAPDFLRTSTLYKIWNDLSKQLHEKQEKQSHPPVDLLRDTLSTSDELVRFCINGFVVVGLMGTLAAFYEMWRHYSSANQGNSDSSSPNGSYLEGMATALVVSFVGLILALMTNLIFSLLKTTRQRFINSVRELVSQSSHPSVPDSDKGPSENLIAAIMKGLENFAFRLSEQHQEMLQHLTSERVDRDKQIQKLFTEMVGSLESLIGQFSKEVAGGHLNLNAASERLASSSQHVATTMAEVSKSLERTKDIEKIVGRLENTSQNITTRISEKLENATAIWAQEIEKSVQAHIRSSQSQTLIMENLVKDLTTKVITDIGALTNEVKDGLVNLKSDFIKQTDTIASHWMTAMSSNRDGILQQTKEIVESLSKIVIDTSASINTALAASKDQVNEITEKIKSFKSEIESLYLLLLELEDKAGAPIHLSKVADDLGLISQLLEKLVPGTLDDQILEEFRIALNSNSATLGDLQESLVGIIIGCNYETIRTIEQTIGALQTSLTLLFGRIESTMIQVNHDGTDGNMTEALDDLKNHLSSLQDDLINGRVSVKLQKNSRVAKSPGNGKGDSSWLINLASLLRRNRGKQQKANPIPREQKAKLISNEKE